MNLIQKNIAYFAESMYQLGLQNVVISPGSRNAPIINVFAQHPHIQCHSRIDERSAAFVALGMAIELKQPVAVLCTSGSALVNYFPAVCEAFYQNVPLIILSADRPPEHINNWNGQCIMQNEIFGKHVLGSFCLNDKIDNKNCSSSIENQVFAAYQMLQHTKGPIHFNIPLREPIYKNCSTLRHWGNTKSEINWTSNIALINKKCPINIADFNKILWINGFEEHSIEKAKNIAALIKIAKFPVLSDVVSGVYKLENVKSWEYVFHHSSIDELKDLMPDLIISTGKAILSKNLKLFLRKYKAIKHVHISESIRTENPFETPIETWQTSIKNAVSEIKNLTVDSSFLTTWNQVMDVNTPIIDKEFDCIQRIVKQVDENTILHISNSMPIRYVAWIKQYCKAKEIRCNRGVSGIDGCSSTAIGSAEVSEYTHILITGDIAFLYDKNAWWATEKNTNLCCIIINNHGGQIFNKIIGAKDLLNKQEFLITHHPSNIKSLASHFGLSYQKLKYNSEVIFNTDWIEIEI